MNYKLFSNTILVKGARNSLICDLQREIHFYLPEGLSEILSKFEVLNFEEIDAHYDNEFTEIISEYFDFLKEFNLIREYLENDENSFTGLSLIWKSPSVITNCIVELSELTILNLPNITQQLSDLGCQFLELRSFEYIDPNKLKHILNSVNIGRLRNIDISLKWSPELDKNEISAFMAITPILGSLIIHSCDDLPSSELDKKNNSILNIMYVDESINSHKHCGIVDKKYFRTNVILFTEAINHNSCLNQKLSIAFDGSIKNCPSISKSYGNIKDISFKEALNDPNFKKLWNINKDKVHVCKDCEFRYICTDCRAFVENPEDIFSKPLKCGYNPYTGEWSEWSINPLKQKAKVYYDMKELAPTIKVK